MGDEMSNTRVYVSIVVAYLNYKKSQKQHIVSRSEIRRILFDEKTSALGPVLRELQRSGLLRKIGSRSYEIL